MLKVEYSIVINRPLAEVFAYLTNPGNEPKYQEGVTEAHLSSGGAMSVGSEISETRKFMGRDMVSKLQVTAFEPNKKFTGKVVAGPVPFEITQTFESAGAGTKIATVIEGEPGGFFKLAEGLVKKQLETQIAGDFERAKKILES